MQVKTLNSIQIASAFWCVEKNNAHLKSTNTVWLLPHLQFYSSHLSVPGLCFGLYLTGNLTALHESKLIFTFFFFLSVSTRNCKLMFGKSKIMQCLLPLQRICTISAYVVYQIQVCCFSSEHAELYSAVKPQLKIQQIKVYLGKAEKEIKIYGQQQTTFLQLQTLLLSFRTFTAVLANI